MSAYPIAIFGGAFLLFLVQPLIAKYILPWFGGGTAVWTVCMLFFQTSLVLGYAYVYGSTRFLGHRSQAAVHVALLVAAVAVLPITPSEAWKPEPEGDPTWRILLLLGTSVGLPLLLVTATSPLLQAWSHTSEGNVSPYRLYALSNAGSLGALLAYPLLIEPRFSLREQTSAWSILFLAFALVSGYCALRVWSKVPPRRRLETGHATASGSPVSQGDRFLWLTLPALSSVLLLAVTNRMGDSVPPAPFLWVLPLALYLGSFVICFDDPRWYWRPGFVTAFVLAFSGVAMLVHDRGAPIWMQITGYSALVFTGSVVCHGELFRLRPPANQLTSFYLAVATGGALGGVLVAVVAPILFVDYLELQLAMFGVSFTLIVLVLRENGFSLPRGRARWIALGLGTHLIAAGILLARELTEQRGALWRTRNFYGALQVSEGLDGRELRHGGVIHGLQDRRPQYRNRPTAYYAIPSGVGRMFIYYRTRGPVRAGAVGLGVGTLSAYLRPQDTIRYYEINPAVVRAATDYFSFLDDCAGNVEVALGDARLSLEAEPPQRLDLLTLDAFSSDAMPVHLLTLEAFEIYRRHLAPDGVIAVHVSNKSLDLASVVCRIADRCGMKSAFIRDVSAACESDWVLVTNNEDLLAHALLRQAIFPDPARLARIPLWTDDRSSILEMVRWGGTAHLPPLGIEIDPRRRVHALPH